MIEDPKIVVIETFRRIGNWELERLKQDNPDVFNGFCSVRKYKVTVELIDEPIEVIHQRIQELNDKSKNIHDWEPLRKEAKKYGYEIKPKK